MVPLLVPGSSSSSLVVRKWSSKSETSLKSKLSIYDTVLLDPYWHGYEQTLLGSPFSCMQNVLSGANSVVQCSSSIGTIWKSLSSMSEDSGVVSLELVEVSMGSLSLLKDRWWHTGLAGKCVGSLADVTDLWGVLHAGLKDACSMLDTWYMQGVFCNGVGKSSLNHFHSLHLPAIAVV